MSAAHIALVAIGAPAVSGWVYTGCTMMRDHIRGDIKWVGHRDEVSPAWDADALPNTHHREVPDSELVRC